MFERYRKPPEPMPLGETVDGLSAEIWQQCMAEDSRFAPSGDEPLLCADKALTQVYNIWRSEDVPRAVRQRAVAVLTAPTGKKLPYEAPTLANDRGVLNLTPRDSTGFREMLNAEIFLMGVGKDRINELAQGVLFWSGQKDERDISIGECSYDSAILQLIPYVDEEIADRLFEGYQLPEPNAYHSGGWINYWNVEVLLINGAIPEKYKQQVLIEWFAAVRRENFHPYGEATQRLVDLLNTDHIDEGVDLGPNVRNEIFIFLGAFGPSER